LIESNVVMSIGGTGEQIQIHAIINGCECRADDFLEALVGFTNKWKADADAFDASKRGPVIKSTVKKPCGCKDQ
jgi:hypothetical protein